MAEYGLTGSLNKSDPFGSRAVNYAIAVFLSPSGLNRVTHRDRSIGLR
jgi:hypothetical protein